MEYKKNMIRLLLLCCYSTASTAWNWSGVLKSKMQTDNRYTQDARFFSEVWGSLEVFDYKSWKGGVDFVSRQSAEETIEADIYQLYMEKNFQSYNSTVKLGRYQRADSLGYYAVDGLNYRYDNQRQGLSLQMYAGIPRRLEDVRSVKGDWLYGLEAQWQDALNWQTYQVSIDDVFLRAGFQQFSDHSTSTRLTLASTITGGFTTPYLQGYELSMMSTYETRTATVEDFIFKTLIDINATTRVRSSYEFYQPKAPFITFREKFYSVYALGQQDLLRLSVNHHWTDNIQYHIGFKRAEREESKVIGYGGNAGLEWNDWRDISLAAEIDYLELGEDKSENIYLSAKYSVTANMKTTINLALANNKKKLYGNNQSTGLEFNSRYRINSALFLTLSGSYIWYSQLDNEYLASLQLTWYMDHFQAKGGY